MDNQHKCHHKNFPMHLTPHALEWCTLVCCDLYSDVHFPCASMTLTFSNSQQTTKMAKVPQTA